MTPRIPPRHAAARRLAHVTAVVVAFVALLITAFNPSAMANAQEKAPAAAAATPDDGKAILPYLDAGTVLVLRLDVDRVEPAALERFLTAMGDRVPARVGVPANQQARMRQEMIEGIEVSQRWLADMSEAGGKRVYVVLLNVADMQQGEGEPLTIVPLGAGANAERIGELLKADAFGSRRQNSEQIGNAMVHGLPGPVTRVREYVAASEAQQPGVNATELAAALAAGGDAPLRLVLVPGETARAWVEDNLPTLPEFLGGGSGKLLARDLRWAAAGLSPDQPKAVARFTVRGADAAKAKALMDVLTRAAAFAKEHVSAMPNGEETAKQLDALKPKVTGDAITFAADPIEMMIGVMGLRMESRSAPTPAPGAEPAKPDDGGL